MAVDLKSFINQKKNDYIWQLLTQLYAKRWHESRRIWHYESRPLEEHLG